MARIVALVLAAAATLGAPAARADLCAERLLVLSAFPGEIDRLLTSADVEQTVTDDDGHTFWVGELAGHDAVLALTGIGLRNAEATTRAALARFRCGDAPAIGGIVFSGVAGGATNIGDVAIPATWTVDGETRYATDPAMLAAAEAIADEVELVRVVPAGDAACVGVDPTLAPTVELPNEPRVLVGGEGKSADPFGGRAFPCIPGGGDVFGCAPCRAPSFVPPDPARFAEGALPFVDPSFFLDYFESPPPASTEYAAEDMESAAVARVATEAGIPFIAFRAMSDGEGDPLMLPGFPFQFFAYRQVAAENAAAVTLAFLEEWPAA